MIVFPRGPRAITALSILLLIWAPAGADGQLPSPARDAAVDLLEVVRSGDRDRIRAFVEARFTPRFVEAHPLDGYHVPVLASLGRQVDGLEAASLELHGPHEVVVSLEGPGRRMRLRLEVEEEPPHRIAYLGWGDAGPELKASSLEELGGELEWLASRPPFSGVVLVARGGEVRFHEAYGPADLEAGRPNDPGTRFDIGSLNKLFTSTAILRLAQEGRLDLADPIGRHLEGFPPRAAEEVTILQLLQHRSGFGDYLSHPDFEGDPKRFREVADLLPLARAQELAFEPGTRQAYSNMGFVVLGAIVERVTGRGYHEAIDGMVFGPAGMTSAGPAGGPGAARRYELRQGRFALVDSLYPDFGTPAGGGFAAAADLHAFVEALLDRKLLDEAHTALLLNGFEAPAGGAGLPERVGFAGGAPGVNAVVLVVPAERRTVVLLANLDPVAAEVLARRIQDLRD